MGRLKTSRHIITLALLVLFTATASAEVCKGSKVPKADLAQYDAQADLLAAVQYSSKSGNSRGMGW